MDLFDTQGHRLYLSESERADFLEAARNADRFGREGQGFGNPATRVSQHKAEGTHEAIRVSRRFEEVRALAFAEVKPVSLTPESIDFAGGAIVFETLKKRRSGVYRAVPVPEDVLDALDMVHGLQGAGKREKKAIAGKPLWDWSRMTAWRRVKEVMDQAGINEGPHKSPKGLRHGFGVHAISKAVPLNMLSKWMGHASLEVTAIYANAVGEEQRNIAARMWE